MTYRSGKSCINACIFECDSLFVPFKYAGNTKRARLQLSAGLLCSSPTAIELVFKMLNNSAASGWRMWEWPSIWNGFSDFCLNAAFTAGRNALLLFFFFLSLNASGGINFEVLTSPLQMLLWRRSSCAWTHHQSSYERALTVRALMWFFKATRDNRLNHLCPNRLRTVRW